MIGSLMPAAIGLSGNMFWEKKLNMASLAYKSVRRAVNILSCLMILICMGGFIYNLPRRNIQKIEEALQQTYNSKFSIFLTYNSIAAMLMGLMGCNAVNSKSKLAMKISTCIGIIYVIALTCMLVYSIYEYELALETSVATSLGSYANGQNTLTLKTILQSSVSNQNMHLTTESVVVLALECIKGEMLVLKGILFSSLCIVSLATVLLLVGTRCQTKNKVEEVIKPLPVHSIRVGVTPAPASLRRRIDERRAVAGNA